MFKSNMQNVRQNKVVLLRLLRWGRGCSARGLRASSFVDPPIFWNPCKRSTPSTSPGWCLRHPCSNQPRQRSLRAALTCRRMLLCPRLTRPCKTTQMRASTRMRIQLGLCAHHLLQQLDHLPPLRPLVLPARAPRLHLPRPVRPQLLAHESASRLQ